VAGLAAGLVARGVVDAETVTYRAKRLEVSLNHTMEDIALVDVVTTSDLWVGTRAIWDATHVQEIVLARAEPGCIGLSSLGSCFQTLDARAQQGMYLALGPGGTQVLAPLGPGLVTWIAVRDHRLVSLGEEVTLNSDAGTIALDGERQIEVYGRPVISVRLTNNGPRVVDICQCIQEGSRRGAFRLP
jgi:hypothetical protein